MSQSMGCVGDQKELMDEEEMRRLYADTDTETDTDTEADADADDKKYNRDVINSDTQRIINEALSPASLKKYSIINEALPANLLKATSIRQLRQSTMRAQTILRPIGNISIIQIRYKSGAEVMFECEQKDDVMEYLVTSIWGSHETELSPPDLLPCLAAIKCLINLCLLKAEFATYITTILLESTDLGQENDNWWLPITTTLENAVDLFKTTGTRMSGTGQMFIVQD
eukprot:322607_1